MRQKTRLRIERGEGHTATNKESEAFRNVIDRSDGLVDKKFFSKSRVVSEKLYTKLLIPHDDNAEAKMHKISFSLFSQKS